MLDRFERALTLPTAIETLQDYLEFFRGYADECHHAREERLLFPALVAAGLPARGGPIGCMLEEHDEGRQRLAEMAAALALLQAGDRSALTRLRSAGKSYVALLRAHIDKENRVLFVMATDLLEPAERMRLAVQFDDLDTEVEFSSARSRGERTVARLVGAAD